MVMANGIVKDWRQKPRPSLRFLGSLERNGARSREHEAGSVEQGARSTEQEVWMVDATAMPEVLARRIHERWRDLTAPCSVLPARS